MRVEQASRLFAWVGDIGKQAGRLFNIHGQRSPPHVLAVLLASLLPLTASVRAETEQIDLNAYATGKIVS